MAGNQQQSWGSFLGNAAQNTIKYTIYGAVAVGAILVGADIVAHAWDALSPVASGVSRATAFGDMIQKGLANLPFVGDKIASYLGVSPVEGFDATKATIADKIGAYASDAKEATSTVGSYLTSWSQKVDDAIGYVAQTAVAHKEVAAVGSAVAVGAIGGSWAQKIADQRSARAQGVEIA